VEGCFYRHIKNSQLNLVISSFVHILNLNKSSFALRFVIAKPCGNRVVAISKQENKEIASSFSLPALLNATGNQRS